MNRINISKDEYLNNLKDIRNYITCMEEQHSLIDNFDRENLDVNIIKQRFTKVMSTPVVYNAVIISLYGCFENYIDKIADSLLDFWVEKADRYVNLANEIKQKNIKKSGEFLVNSNRFKNFEITELEVIKNLYSCFEEEKFSLNKELLLTHSGNLGIDQLIELFNDLGIKNSKAKILGKKKFVEYIKNKNEFSDEKAKEYINKKKGGDVNRLFEELTQLVEQRNKVAHGWCVDTRLSNSVLVEQIIPFMEMMGQVICDIFEEELIIILQTCGLLNEIDMIIDVYNNNILCINSKKSRLKVGEYIFAYTGKDYNRFKILNIQHNEKDIQKVEEDNIDVGILVDGYIKKNWKYYYT